MKPDGLNKETETESFESGCAFFGLFATLGIWHGPGWYGLTMPLIKEIQRYNKSGPKAKASVAQIREIRGRLAIYALKSPAYITEMILKAENESEHVCELCGARGKLRNIRENCKTLCDAHHKSWTQALKGRKQPEETCKGPASLKKRGCKEYSRKQTHRHTAGKTSTEEL